MCVLSRSVISDLCNPMDYRLPGSSVHGIFQVVLQDKGAHSCQWRTPTLPFSGWDRVRDRVVQRSTVSHSHQFTNAVVLVPTLSWRAAGLEPFKLHPSDGCILCPGLCCGYVMGRWEAWPFSVGKAERWGVGGKGCSQDCQPTGTLGNSLAHEYRNTTSHQGGEQTLTRAPPRVPSRLHPNRS